MTVSCTLCPHNCRLKPEQWGVCRVRRNRQGKLDTPYAGVISGLSMDPIEKKPLYHYHPGKPVLSLGFYGCSLRCPFCQNYDISQKRPSQNRRLSPAEAVDLAKKHNSFGIAYTYSEPAVHFEWVLETAELARKEGIKNVLVSNGYLNPEPARGMIAAMDAANIDLKGFQPDFYRRELKGDLEPVKEFITQACGRIHLEVTTLIIPGKNDSPEEMDAMTRFLADLSPDIPYHLSAYYPHYHYTLPATDPEDLLTLVKRAKTRMNHVYAGNILGGDNSTRCGSCGSPLIERMGYHTRLQGIENGRCKKCGAPAPVVLE